MKALLLFVTILLSSSMEVKTATQPPQLLNEQIAPQPEYYNENSEDILTEYIEPQVLEPQEQAEVVEAKAAEIVTSDDELYTNNEGPASCGGIDCFTPEEIEKGEHLYIEIGETVSPSYVPNEVIFMAENEEQAKKIAEDYGLELKDFVYGVATLDTGDKTADDIIQYGKDHGLEEVYRNGYNYLFSTEYRIE